MKSISNLLSFTSTALYLGKPGEIPAAPLKLFEKCHQRAEMAQSGWTSTEK
jgi:hypothetical protein